MLAPAHGHRPYCGAMSDLPARLESALGARYRIQRELGRGGMSTVYLAEDTKHGRPVAVKVLTPELAQSIGSERFLREIEVAAKLSHPNILPLFDSGDADGLLYYVMPYVEGPSLRDRIGHERHLALDEAVGIVGGVAAALSYAHGQGLVHRDIKPENILLVGGQAVVADFGIARAIDVAGTDRLTATGLAVGTPAYMSPEQADARGTLDARADVYSLGCVAYEMLAGEPPFSGSSPLAVMARHAVDPVPSLRTLRSTIPPGVERAIERALAKVPADRYETAEEFADALAGASTAEAVAREERRARGMRWLGIAATGAAVLLLGAGGWWVAHVHGRSGIRRFAVLPFVDAANDSAHRYVLDGVQDALISDLARDGLGVIARTSVMQYRNTDEPVRSIARELNVDAVVEASVTRTADSVSLDAGLVDAHTEQYLWSHAYSVPLAEIPSLARTVSGDIARALRPGRSVPEPVGKGGSRAIDPDAYDAYLHGMSYLHRPTPQDLRTARDYFERAIARDSTYAPAWAGLSEVWTVGRQRGYYTPQQATPPSEEAAYKALALDSTLAEPHYALAEAKVYGEWDWAGGEREFRRAVALEPDYATARAFYAHLLCILGRPQEAMRQMERARELDPLDPLLAWIEGGVLTMTGRYDDAIGLYRAALQRSPDEPGALWLLWLTLHQAGRHDEAYPAVLKWAVATGDSGVAHALKSGRRQAGYAGAMRAAADYEAARSRTTFIDAWTIAIWYATAGENDKALDWLERAYDERDPTMPYLGVHPSFAALHGDPRFQALVRRMKLPVPGTRR